MVELCWGIVIGYAIRSIMAYYHNGKMIKGLEEIQEIINEPKKSK